MPTSIEYDLKEVLDQINSKLDNLDRKFEQKIDNLDRKFEQKIDQLSEDIKKLEIGQAELKGEVSIIKSEISTMKGEIKQMKGSQGAQIWTLIGLAFTSVLGLLGALAKILFLPNLHLG